MKTFALHCPWLGKNALAVFVAVIVVVPFKPTLGGATGCKEVTIDFVTIDFYVSDEWAKFGLTLSAPGGFKDLPRVFDTSYPGDEETGLGSPNERCDEDDPGPGIGEGGEPGGDGENCSPLGNVLIVQEDNDSVDILDDNEFGGVILFDFEEVAKYVSEIALLDVEEKSAYLVVISSI